MQLVVLKGNCARYSWWSSKEAAPKIAVIPTRQLYGIGQRVDPDRGFWPTGQSLSQRVGLGE